MPYVFIGTKKKKVLVETNTIYYIQSQGNYTMVVYEKGKLLSCVRMSVLIKKLHNLSLLKLRRGLLINTTQIETVEHICEKKKLVTLKDNTQIHVSRRQLDGLNDIL